MPLANHVFMSLFHIFSPKQDDPLIPLKDDNFREEILQYEGAAVVLFILVL